MDILFGDSCSKGKNENQFYFVVIYLEMFDVDINSGNLKKKTDNFLNQNANLMVSF